MTPRLGWPDACQPGCLVNRLPVSPVAWFCGRLAARLPGFAADWRPGCLVLRQIGWPVARFCGRLVGRLPGFGTEAFLSYFLVPVEQL